MRSRLLQVIACTHLVVFSTEGGAALLSSRSAGSPEAVLGARQSLDEILPTRLRVVDGEAVPIPATFWLFGSGLLALTGFARPRKAFSGAEAE